MKKASFSALFLCAVLIISVMVSPVCASAQIDTEKRGSLSILYKYDDEPYAGLKIKTYKIADVVSDGTFELTESFSKYHIDLYGISSQEEWKTVASTAGAYIEADGIEPTITTETDVNGKAMAENMDPGLYLTASVKSVTEKNTVVFDSFLTVIPDKNEDGSYNYNVEVYPKVSSYTPTYKEVEYKVVKLWKDADSVAGRPETVKAEIYCNGELKYAKTLSAENNWTYSWTAPDNGDSWTVCERDVDKAYTVTVERTGATFILTNTSVVPPEDGVQTGDIIASWPFILCVLLLGIVTVVIIIWRRGSGKK